VEDGDTGSFDSEISSHARPLSSSEHLRNGISEHLQQLPHPDRMQIIDYDDQSPPPDDIHVIHAPPTGHSVIVTSLQVRV